MDALADELRRSLEFRAEALATYVDQLRGELGSGRPGLAHALDLVRVYPDALRGFAASSWENSPDSTSRIDMLHMLLRHLLDRSHFVEQWFGTGASPTVPLSLVRGVERSCPELGLGEREAVLAVGPPDNFETYVADLNAYLFGDLRPPEPEIPDELKARRFAMILVPRLEGGEVMWSPVVLGHELAHLAVIAHGATNALPLAENFDWDRADAVDAPTTWQPKRLVLFRIAQNWATELLCDAFAVRKYGPAGVAALSEFLDVVGATGAASMSHPPAWTRMRLLMGWLGEVDSARVDAPLAPWRSIADAPRPEMDEWAAYLCEVMERLADDFPRAIETWPGPYDVTTRATDIEWAADRLRAGVPVGETRHQEGEVRNLSDEDVVNGAWVANHETTEIPIHSLAAKSVSTFEFLRDWKDSGGGSPSDPQGGEAEEPATGILSRSQIEQRLAAGDLIVTPLLPEALGASAVDVRLGSRFIVFRRTRTRSFDPLNAAQNPRTMQREIENGWGEEFVLHPDELVLATTLEYISLPADIGAQVITRSSYGRLGLITATAIQVHPHFKGCLTLELVNLGMVPLQLVPGERIAQLVFVSVAPPVPEPTGKYRYPTGPEFSRVLEDEDMPIIREMRRRARLRAD